MSPESNIMGGDDGIDSMTGASTIFTAGMQTWQRTGNARCCQQEGAI
jgi:hypothetical protein